MEKIQNTNLPYPLLDVVVVKEFQTWLNSNTNLRPSSNYSSFYSLALFLIKNKIKCMAIVGLIFLINIQIYWVLQVGEPEGKHFENNINSGVWEKFRELF